MPMPFRTVGALAVLAALAPALQAQPAAAIADAIYTNARIWTGDAAHPTAQALALRDGTLIAVGSAADVLAHRGPATRMVDLQGRRVVPGFSDAHWHLPTTDQADLTDAKSPAEIVRRLKAWAAKRPAGGWVLGRGWTPSDFPNNTPHRRFLDVAFPGQPVVLTDRDGHQSIANGRALALAKVTAETPDPPRGVIEREAKGVLIQEYCTTCITKHTKITTGARALGEGRPRRGTPAGGGRRGTRRRVGADARARRAARCLR